MHCHRNPPEKEKVGEALGAISDALNAVERFYFKGGCSFDAIAAHNGAATLIHVLGFGVRERERMQTLISDRKFDDLNPPESI